jgi:hypothetical protein
VVRAAYNQSVRPSTIALTALALLAFAANSLLCRMALHPASPNTIDAFSFTALRVVAGALALSPLLVRSLRASGARPPLRSAVALFVYALASRSRTARSPRAPARCCCSARCRSR